MVHTQEKMNGNAPEDDPHAEAADEVSSGGCNYAQELRLVLKSEHLENHMRETAIIRHNQTCVPKQKNKMMWNENITD